MPSNIIIFEAEYVSELVNSMNSACELMSEAMQSLRQASLHEGWKCKECASISEGLDDLNVRLGRLDEGVNDVTRVLGGSVSRFTTLEESYKSQVKNISDDLTHSHGYAGEVHTGTSETQGSSAAGNNDSASASSSSSSSSSGGTDSSGSSSGKGKSSSGRASSMASSAGGAGVIVSGGGKSPSSSSSGKGFGHSGGSMNLPVTHIPDRPEAAAKGVKFTQEIADTAVSRVARKITEALHSNPRGMAGSEMSAKNLVEAYNAGKIIVENSVTIISAPSMPHTKERLAIAEGIADLAGSSAFVITGDASANSSGIYAGMADMNMRENFRHNAGNLASAVHSVDNGDELNNVLNMFTGEVTEEISPFTLQPDSGGRKNFFDMIVESVKQNLRGGNESLSASNSPIDEFMKNLITE